MKLDVSKHVLRDGSFLIIAILSIMQFARYVYTQEYLRSAKYLVLFLITILMYGFVPSPMIQSGVNLIMIVLLLGFTWYDERIDKRREKK